MNKLKKETIAIVAILFALSISMFTQFESSITGYAVADFKEIAVHKLWLIFTALSIASLFLFLLHNIHSSSVPMIRTRINDAHYSIANGNRQKAVKRYKMLLKTYNNLPDDEKEGIYSHLIELHKALNNRN